MNSERWERVQRLIEQAHAVAPEARDKWLETACAGDAELRDEVLSLLEAPSIDEMPNEWLGALASVSHDRFAPGDRVAGRYRIEKLLGRGGAGEVYAAYDDELSIEVALKTLRLDNPSTTQLKLEGMLARSIWHPHVCRVYDLGCDGDGPDAIWFLTMELLHGDTLAQRLCELGRLTPEQALPLVEQMASALGAAHQVGVVHRDFKPGNVMLVGAEGAEQAIVTDFGTARTAERHAGSGASGESAPILGTPAYMAPEQVLGESVGPAADLYALGVVLFEMMTGELPFRGESAYELARERLDREAPSPRSVAPELDARWDAVIRRCLAREPGRRFARAEEIVTALHGRASVAAVDGTPHRIDGRHTLPSERDRFVGRQSESDELELRLGRESRVVTLLGAAGMGKTRLAARHGWRSLATWPGGVWYCDLAEARDLGGIVSAVAGALGLQLGRADPIEQLGHAIAGRGRCLLVLDNFEQLVEYAGETVGRWQRVASEACFLVTSRERLHLEGEHVLVVEPLSIEEAAELFAARARELRPGLERSRAESEAALEIARLVDGMPLAIELAAARVRVMSATRIVAQMRKRFQLLTGGRSAHHETLERTIDLSWELLSPWEQAAWLQASVFEGGFTLGAAEAVLDLRAWPGAPSVVDVVQSLVDKSLVRILPPEAGSREPRFTMYVSLLYYARAKLGASDATVAERRHGDWCARFGTDEAIERLIDSAEWRALEREVDNVTAACRRAIGRGDGPIAVSTYRALWEVIKLRGPFGVAVELGNEVLKRTGLQCSEEAYLVQALGQAEVFAGTYDAARAHLERALAIARAEGRRRMECGVLNDLGRMFAEQGKPGEARVRYTKALEIAREIGDRRFEGVVLNSLGWALHFLGEIDEARAFQEAAIMVARSVGDRRTEGVTLVNLGILHQNLGRADEARERYEAALAIHREMGNRRSEGITHLNLGSLETDLGRVEKALHHLEAALSIARTTGMRSSEGVSLIGIGELHSDQERDEEAKACFEAALVIHRELGDRSVEAVCLGNLAHLLHRSGSLAEARVGYEAALAMHREVGDKRYEGSVLMNLGMLCTDEGDAKMAHELLSEAERILREIDANLEVGKLLCTRAELEWRGGDTRAATATMQEAIALSERVGAGPDSALGRALTRLRTTLEARPAPS